MSTEPLTLDQVERHAIVAGWNALRKAFAERPDLLHPGVADHVAKVVIEAARPILARSAGSDFPSPTCPGCGAPLTSPEDCDRCEYFNLAAGRSHYCGQDSCYCRALRGAIKPEVLGRFAAERERDEARSEVASPTGERDLYARMVDESHAQVADLLTRLAESEQARDQARGEEERYRRESLDARTDAGRLIRELGEARAEVEKLRAATRERAEDHRDCQSCCAYALDALAIADVLLAGGDQSADRPAPTFLDRRAAKDPAVDHASHSAGWVGGCSECPPDTIPEENNHA